MLYINNTSKGIVLPIGGNPTRFIKFKSLDVKDVPKAYEDNAILLGLEYTEEVMEQVEEQVEAVESSIGNVKIETKKKKSKNKKKKVE